MYTAIICLLTSYLLPDLFQYAKMESFNGSIFEAIRGLSWLREKKSLSLPEASLHPVFFSTLFMVVCFRTKPSPVVPGGGWGGAGLGAGSQLDLLWNTKAISIYLSCSQHDLGKPEKSHPSIGSHKYRTQQSRLWAKTAWRNSSVTKIKAIYLGVCTFGSADSSGICCH